jgi:hypothetical protein
MSILLAGTIEFVDIEQVFALFMFHLGQVLLYKLIRNITCSMYLLISRHYSKILH